MNKNEKTWIILTLFLLGLLVIKSTLLDPNLGQLTSQESLFVQEIEKVILETEPENMLYKSGFLQQRIVGVRSMTDTEFESIQLKESQVLLQYPYKAKVRKYALWIIPYGEITMLK